MNTQEFKAYLETIQTTPCATCGQVGTSMGKQKVDAAFSAATPPAVRQDPTPLPGEDPTPYLRHLFAQSSAQAAVVESCPECRERQNRITSLVFCRFLYDIQEVDPELWDALASAEEPA